MKRRKDAEDLLAWKRRLDQEEKEIAAMERKALAKFEREKSGEKTPTKTKTKASEEGEKVTSPSSASKSTGSCAVSVPATR